MSRIGWDLDEPKLDQVKEDKGMQARLVLFRAIIAAAIVVLLYRVIYLQQTGGQQFQALADANRIATIPIPAPRGVIFDRNGNLLADNTPSFNITITPAFLPRNEQERMAVYERLSDLTGVPITNTVEQQELLAAADPELVGQYSRLAGLYGVSTLDTLDQSGVVERLPNSIMNIVDTVSFRPFVAEPIKRGVTITEAYTIAQESIFLPGVQVIPQPLRLYPNGEFTASLIGFMGPLPNENYLELGYLRNDRVGLFGLESSMERWLRGVKGQRVIEVDWTGRELRQIGAQIDPIPGYNLHLTLDTELQEVAYNILLETIEERRQRVDRFGQPVEVEQGVVIAMRPDTGEVLAMVNIPTFDNNRFATEIPLDYYLGLARNEYLPMFNHAVGGQYPPGSIYKVITAAAALQEGVISPLRQLYDPGQILIPNRFAPNDPGRVQSFICWIFNQFGIREHGLVNMYTGIAWSCDTYFYKVNGGFNQDGEFIEGLGVDRLYDYADQFGLGRIQGIELPLEAPGINPSRSWKQINRGEPWSTGDDYNMGIGQGFVTTTPLQMVQMTNVIINGGFLYRPTLIHHITDADGNIVVFDRVRNDYVLARPGNNGQTEYMDVNKNPLTRNEVSVNVLFDANGEFVFQPEVLNPVNLSRETLEVVKEGMWLVNQLGGTGRVYTPWLEDFGIVTGGKSGSAEYCDNIAIRRGWCIEGQILPTHAWFVGFAPYENPEIAVVAFIFNGGEGSEWAGPVVRNVLAAYFGVDQFDDGDGGRIPERANVAPTGIVNIYVDRPEETSEDE